MKKHNLEFVVGLFVLAGLLCVGYLTIKLGKMELFSENGYVLHANFSSVTGLRSGALVSISGVPVGKVTNIGLNPKNPRQATVTMRIKEKLDLGADTLVSIKTNGLIGDKYLALTPGKSKKTLESGDTCLETESVVDIEELISKFISGGSSMESLSARGTVLHAQFASVAGLSLGASVQISGVQVGTVSEITLNYQKQTGARVTMLVAPEVNITDDAIASIKSSSLIGGKYINISQGGSTVILASGDEITDTESSVDLEALISKYVFGGV